MELTWLGHSTFRLDAEGKRVYIDPFLNGNPKCPEAEQTPEQVDVIAITHAHGDHLGDTVDLAKKHGCAVVAPGFTIARIISRMSSTIRLARSMTAISSRVFKTGPFILSSTFPLYKRDFSIRSKTSSMGPIPSTSRRMLFDL